MRHRVWAALLVVASIAGCGNYSNDDLAFMEALPREEALVTTLPGQGALTLDADEWYRNTKALVAIFNGAVESSLLLVGKIRRNLPTRRIPDGRIWGPFPADDKPGWSWMMVMTLGQDATGATTFAYRLGFLPTGRSDETSLVVLLSGTFSPNLRTEGGHGTISFDTLPARAQGVPLGDVGNLASLVGSYANDVWPKTIDLTWTPFMPQPPVDPRGLGDPSHATYHFQQAQNGEGRLVYGFDDASNPAFLPGPAGLDQITAESRWQATGPGRTDVTVTAGDFQGVAIVHCWDRTFETVYATQLGGMDVGDVASCAYPAP